MYEQSIRKTYMRELMSALMLYVLVLLGTVWASIYVNDPLWKTLLLASPTVTIGLVIWAMVRRLKRIDEYARLVSLQSLAIAAAVTAAWTLTYGFLESAGFPRLSMSTVWPVMGLVWGVMECGLQRRRA